MGSVWQFFQPPLYWQQFEDLCVGMLTEVYNVPDAKQYGRPGQPQNGVDVYGRSSRHGMIGIQCKRLTDTDQNLAPLPGGKISRAFFRTAAKEALKFTPDLNIWILATTVRRDTRMQGWVDELNEEWAKADCNRLAIVWTWDECISFLNSYPSLQRAYYDSVIKIHGAVDLDRIFLQNIAMAFSRPAFEVGLNCETQNEFIQALKDTQKALRTGELVDRETRQVIRKAIGGYHEISDEQLRDDLNQLDKQLRILRSQLEQGFKSGAIQQIGKFINIIDHNLIHTLEDLRQQCLNKLNSILVNMNLPRI